MNSSARIYLDNNATTLLDPQVLQAMLTELQGPPANPSSLHYFGQRAKILLTKARKTVAAFFDAKAEEVIFTSGGTEGLNFLLKGLFSQQKPQGHLITTTIEHSCVYQTILQLQGAGLDVTFLPTGERGAPLPVMIEEAIRPTTRALVLSAANGETGAKIDITEIASIAQKKGIPFILDAVAMVGKEPIPSHPGISALALSAHKFHGPKGVGAVIVKPSFKTHPLFIGGAQENFRRAGTENLSAILGLAESVSLLQDRQETITQHLLNLREHFESTLSRELKDFSINATAPRVANTTNCSIYGVDGETLLIHLDMAGIAASHGSACSSGAIEPSRVLLNMGLDQKRARSSLRFSLSRFNTRLEIDQALERIIEIVSKLRNF